MSATIIEDIDYIHREDTPLPIYLYLQIPGTITANVKNMRDIQQSDFASPGGITIGAYYEDETVIVAAASLTVSSVVYNTLVTGDAGPDDGHNFYTVAPATFFPASTSNLRVIVEVRFTTSDAVLWRVVRISCLVLPVAGS